MCDTQEKWNKQMTGIHPTQPAITAQPYLPNMHGRVLSCDHWDYFCFWRNFLNCSFKSHFPLRSQTHRFPKALGLWFGRKPWTERENVALCSSLASSQHCDFGKPFCPVSFSFTAVKKQIARVAPHIVHVFKNHKQLLMETNPLTIF